ncbi:MAG: hypothetical protein JWQ95_2136 [Sphaerisporangium sp.]|nr:hypothetical protein [Sphaerisporangium sp.]
MHKPVGRALSDPALDWEVTTVKTIQISTSATPWLASQCAGSTTVSVAGARRITAPITMPATLGLAANGAAKLRQEKTALLQARLGSAAFAYGTIGMVTDHTTAFGRQAGDPQTTSTANGGVQGPPPWRKPVIT